MYNDEAEKVCRKIETLGGSVKKQDINNAAKIKNFTDDQKVPHREVRPIGDVLGSTNGYLGTATLGARLIGT